MTNAVVVFDYHVNMGDHRIGGLPTPVGASEPATKGYADATKSTVLADLTAMRAAVLAVTAKLDLDGGVTDTNYAATCNPAALTTA